MRILYIRHDVVHHPNPATLTDLVYVKAFRSMGHEVIEYDFRTRNAQIGTDHMNEELIEIAKDRKPQMIMMGKCESIAPETIAAMKNTVKDVKIVLWYGDQRAKVVDLIAHQAANVDLFLHTTGGERLQEYRKACGKPSGFIPFAVDHTLCCPGPVAPEFRTNKVVFCGGEHMPGTEYDFHRERYETLCALRDVDVCKFYGCFGEPQVTGDAYIQVMRGAPAVISISGYARWDKYISDRPLHVMACGSLLIQYSTPKIETLFQSGYIPFGSPAEAVKISQEIIGSTNNVNTTIHFNKMRVAGLNISRKFSGKHIIEEISKMMRGEKVGAYPWYEYYP